MKITKEYNINVYRKISEGTLVNDRPKNSLINIQMEDNKNIDYKDDIYTTKIFDIKRHKNKTVIKSNTLGLKITNKKVNNVWLYDYIVVSTTVDPSSLGINTYYVEKKDNQYYIYFNKESNKTFLMSNEVEYIINPVVILNNSVDLESYINIERKKTHIEITINTSETYNIELISDKLFYPKIYNNVLEFYECVFNYGGKVLHLYTHTLIENVRKEVVESCNDLKRPLLMVNKLYMHVDDIFIYNSYRSNLMYVINNLDKCYFYIKDNAVDTQDIIVVRESDVPYKDLTPLFVINNVKTASEITLNPLYNNIKHEAQVENYIFNDPSLATSKYGSIYNTPMGCLTIPLTIENIINNKQKILNNGNIDIYNSDTVSLENVPIYNIQQDNRISNKHKEFVSILKNKLNNLIGV